MKITPSLLFKGALCVLPSLTLAGCLAPISLPEGGNNGMTMPLPVEVAKKPTPTAQTTPTPQTTLTPTSTPTTLATPQVTPTPMPLRASPNSDFEVTASTTKTPIKAGETATFEITVKNASDHDALLQFSSGQSFDFTATKEAATEPTWKWSADKMFLQALRMQRLQAGEYRRFTANWENVPEGKYQIQGTITANKGINATPFELEVTP